MKTLPYRGFSEKITAGLLVSVVLLSLSLAACRSNTASLVNKPSESQTAADTALSHLKEQGFSYAENAREVVVSGGSYDGQAVWLVSVLPKNHTPIKSREIVTTVINGKEVQLEKITPNGPDNGPTVAVSKADGSVVNVNFSQ